ncbi:RDD family protein [Halorussus salilacus]|uniref:RDD family protein n=1 Tax=Halorussus salilacus TaxID=2953750 RepID=UPI00209D133E|nr:RDD family protein [Halorussus salilacus]USZ69542.1 RDD family protein [Halorussus salilacus]
MERHPTPNVDEYAGVLDNRIEALLIDGLLVALVAGALGYVGGTLAVDGPLGGLGGAILALQFGTPIGLIVYHTAFEGYYGQTVGKRLRGIVVVKRDGSPVTWTAAVIRNFLRIVDMLPIFYIVGVVVAYVTDDRQRVGDLAGRTVVVHTQN